MTTRKIVHNGKFGLTASNTIKIGPYYSKTQSGGNYLVGEPRGTPHAYSVTLLSTLTGYYGYLMWGKQYLAEVTPGLSILSTGWTANDDLKLANKLVEQTKLVKSSLGASVATGRQTIDMIGNRLSQLVRTVKFIKRGDLGNATKTLFGDPRYKGRKIRGFSPSGSVLEFNYGWSPLFRDIQDSVVVLQQSYRDSFKHVVRARHKKFDVVTTDPAFAFSSAESYQKKQVIAYLSVDPQHDLARNLGLTDYASILWEVVPFSFVVDWVYPLGSFLELRDTLQQLSGTFVVTEMHMSRAVANGFGPMPPRPGGTIPNLEFTTGMTKSVNLRRTVQASYPALRLPALKSPFSFDTTGGKTRVLNAIALLGSLLGH